MENVDTSKCFWILYVADKKKLLITKLPRSELIDILSYTSGKVIPLERTETCHTTFLYTGYMF